MCVQVDLTVRVKIGASKEQVIAALREASEGELKGFLGVTDEELVSTDILGDPRSSVFDVDASIFLNDNFFKLVSWYDNEFGYSNRVVDLVNYVHSVETAK
jgi:glyceraldehyde 3-phosphate dehydrogenase